MNGCVNGWVDRWADGCVFGWKLDGGRKDEWMAKRIDKWRDDWTDE